jgi:light-harvesting complex 1 alpha chain
MWMHPMRVLVVLYAFLGLLAFMIHFILMSTDRYNWFLDTSAPKKKAEMLTDTVPVKLADLGARIG